MYQNSSYHLQNVANARLKANQTMAKCQFCEKEARKCDNTRHEKNCYLNPKNIRHCPVCNTILKYKKSSTCSVGCANTYFRSGFGPRRKNWNKDRYRAVCFHYHEAKCVCCDEKNIVEVHHLDEDKTNNDPSNLIPLCPTHHQYWHSRFRPVIETDVRSYIEKWTHDVRGRRGRPDSPTPG